MLFPERMYRLRCGIDISQGFGKDVLVYSLYSLRMSALDDQR